MNEHKLSKQIKELHTIALVNVGIWTIALVALVILLQKGGNIKGMFVILAGGSGVGIQIIALVSKLNNQ